MADDDDGLGRRRPWSPGPAALGASAEEWLALSDDELLFRVEALSADHQEDARLIAVVCSARHFFVRQEAAKKIRDRELLKAHSNDRHIGQILVRTMTRAEDVAYLRRLIQDSRHVEVKKAAEAQLRVITTG